MKIFYHFIKHRYALLTATQNTIMYCETARTLVWNREQVHNYKYNDRTASKLGQNINCYYKGY